MSAPGLILVAPMRGWISALDEAPDPVFAGRMLGDGLVIDPIGATLHAPCDGRLLAIHPAGHAATLRTAEGAELLLHVGLETVGLGGEGFSRHAEDGAEVAAGQLLIGFDLDLVARRAKSLITPIVVTNGDEFAIVRRAAPGPCEVGDFLMEIAGGQTRQRSGAGEQGVSRRVAIPLAHGLHARPAAVIAAEAKRHLADVILSAGDRSVNAKSPVAIMTLGLGHGAEATLWASGPGAEAALAAVGDLIEHGLPPEPAAAPAPAAPVQPPVQCVPPSSLKGTPAAPGLAIGSAVRLAAPEIAIAEGSGDADIELAALHAALAAVRGRIEETSRTGVREQREIAAAHLAFLDDEELIAEAVGAIHTGVGAGRAWRDAIRVQVNVLRQIEDPLIAQRADDLIDLERQVLIELSGEDEPPQILPDNAILLAEDLAPSQLIGVAGRLAGLCTAAGGPTSHVAILATAMNIPAVVAAGAGVMAVPDGATLILDGDRGLVRIAPGAAEIEAAQLRLARSQAERRESMALAAEPCRMADGTRIEVFANVGAEADATAAVAAGGEGCGLLRTEFLFLERQSAPNEAEQAAAYQAVATALEGRPLVIRTLDVGGDKPAPYLALPAEDNPAMGLRGVRVSLARPDLLRTQLRAILRVQPRGQCRIMIPMVASLAELSAVRALLDEARRELGVADPVELGVMVETPAAAITADTLAAEADFLSIGTNDLTQYALAMDRGNPALAAQADALHPAILRLIAATVSGARKHGRPVSVCGGLAADPLAAPILIGLGVTRLSVPPAVVPTLKAAVRMLTAKACEALAARALALSSAAEVRSLAVNSGEWD